MVVLEPVGHLGANHSGAGEEIHLVRVEVEGGEGLQGTPGTGDDTVASAGWQLAREEFEDTAAKGRARAHCGLDHRQFVVVGEQRGGHAVRLVGTWGGDAGCRA